ncbi:MAG: diguanylate cyclase [Rhodocyclaceae bacterium]|nr:diguanylate cyclase [Rhodocyclaceae bacterium]
MKADDFRDILPQFLSHANAAIAIKDLDGRYLFVNDAFARYAGTPCDQVVGMVDGDLLPAERARRAGTVERDVLASGRGATDSECFLDDGETIAFEVARFPVFCGRDEPVALGLIAIEIGAGQREVFDAERALKEAQAANAQLRSAIFTLEELASTDRLTNAWNRRRFEETLEGETHRSARYGHPLSMLLIDVDHFKRVNDQHGHLEGDRVLVSISTLVRTIMRKSDSLTRWGGEEFIVLMPNTGLGRAQATARRICETIAATDIEGIGHLTVSIGAAEYLPAEAADEWIARADQAMYLAKQGGRNRVEADTRRSLTQNHVEHLEGNFVQLVWKDAFSSGHPLIDSQHRGLFERANELLDAMLSGRPRDEVLVVIESLLFDVGKHFRDEEWILGALHFDCLADHRQKHAKLMSRCHALVEEFEAGIVPLGELFEFLAHELITRHFLGADREYFWLIPEGSAHLPPPE